MKIRGSVLYDLFRYAYKNSLFDEKENINEVSKVFSELRSSKYKNIKLSNVEFEIKLTKIGRW